MPVAMSAFRTPKVMKIKRGRFDFRECPQNLPIPIGLMVFECTVPLFLQNDADNLAAQKYNNDLIWEKCSKNIQRTGEAGIA